MHFYWLAVAKSETVIMPLDMKEQTSKEEIGFGPVIYSHVVFLQ